MNSPQATWRRDAWALLLAMTFPSLMSWIEFTLLPGLEGKSPTMKVVFALGKLLQFSFPFLYVRWKDPQDIAAPRPHLRGMAVGAGLGVVIAIGMWVLYFTILKPLDFFQDTPAKLAELLLRLHANTPLVFFAMALFISVLHSMLEEYYWRWFVLGRLQRHARLGPALAISGLAFMSHHIFVLSYYFPGRFWIAALPFSLCVAVAGVIWGWLYHRYGTIYAPWVSHVLADAAIMVVGYDMVCQYWV